MAATDLGLSWIALIALPQLVERLEPIPLSLIVIGWMLYSIGTLVYARKRAYPGPRTCGFREVFHAFVIAAAVAHFIAMAGWVIRRRGS